MNGNLTISNYLNEIYEDWQDSREEFPHNTYPPVHWPIPFFGNPATALVATIGVNPSSNEFEAGRGWPVPTRANRGAWKQRLNSYFNHQTPADDWFDPWRIGLALLDCSHKVGTAAHFDVSYRPSKAMHKNQRIDPEEFRTMVERDVQWLFKLLPVCPKLRMLLTMGPIIGNDLRPMPLLGFLHEFCPRYGFNVIRNGEFQEFWHAATRKVLVTHEADTLDEKCITCRVVKNLHTHRDEPQSRLAEQDGEAHL